MLLRRVAGGGVCSLVFSADGSTIYTGDGGGWVSSWQRGSDEPRKLFQIKGRHASDIWRLAVTRDGKRILAGTPGSFAVWDVETENLWPAEPTLAVDNVFALAADDRTLAAVRDISRIVFSDLERRAPNADLPVTLIPGMISDLLFSPADGTLAVVDETGGLYLVEPGEDRPLPINSGAEDERIEFSDWCRYLAFSPDGRTLATCGGRAILLWDVAARQLRRTIKAGRALVRQLAFHPDGKLLASGGDTPVVTLWDVNTGKKVDSFDWGIGSKILSLAFAPDGLTAAAGGSNRQYVVWDLES